MRWMLTFVGVLVVLGGLLPLIKDKVSGIFGFLPTEGTGYQVLIILIGVIAIIYGIRKRRTL